MNKITLIGYLKHYFLNTKKTGTLGIRKLAQLAEEDGEMFEHTALFAALTGREYLCAGNVKLYNECIRLKEADDIPSLSPAYRAIYNRYESFSREKYDDDFKNSVRNRILEIQKDKNISNYRIYTDLSLNPGNVNSFLKNGDCNKLSVDVIRRIWKYVERI